MTIRAIIRMPRPLPAAPESATLSPPSGDRQPPSVDRVAAYDRALAGLQRHLLPLLRADLNGVAARTGLPAETLRKRRRDLERGVRSLPSADALVAIATAYGWSLDALLDGSSETPTAPEHVPPDARGIAPVLRAHIERVITTAVRRTRPWGLDLVLGTDPEELLERFERQTAERVHDLIVERERQRQQQCEEDWRFAQAHLAGSAVVERITTDAALAPWSEALVARLQHAVGRGKWDFMEGRFVFPLVAVRATDPWALARGFAPAIRAIIPLVGRRIGEALGVAFEVTPAEVEAARNRLARPAGRGAGIRACSLDEVLDVYERLCQHRRHRPNAPLSLAAISESSEGGDRGPAHDMWALHDLFAAFCVHTGLVWQPAARHFTLAAAGRGSFVERLAPHPRHAQLIVVPWGVEYWNPAGNARTTVDAQGST